MRKIEDEVGRLKERHPVKHYRNTYSEPYLPPSWVMSECVTFGFWSRTYKVLQDPAHKRAIARKFGVNQPEVFESWLHCVTYLRNLVAHHGQLLGTQLRIAPQNYKGTAKHGKPPSVSLHLGADTKSLHAAAKMMNFLVKRTHLPCTFKSDLTLLFAAYPPDFAISLGFSPGWETHSDW